MVRHTPSRRHEGREDRHRRPHRQRGGGKDRAAATGDGGGVRPMWSGTISFGLVSVPVTLWPAVREGRVSMRMLTESGHTMGRRYYSQKTDREIHPEHIIRGYKVDEDKFVPISDEELESVAPEKSRDIDLRRFVPLKEIDPILFVRPYFLLPAEGTNKAYRLLAEVMERTGKAGIATFVMRDTEYLVAILADGGILRAQTMRFPDEVRSPEDLGLPEPITPAKKDVDRFLRAIQSHTARKFDPSLLEDRDKQNLLKLIASKTSRKQDVIDVEVPAGEDDGEGEPGGRSMQSLMAALEESMAAAGKRKKK